MGQQLIMAESAQRPGAPYQELPEHLEMALQTIALCNQMQKAHFLEDEEGGVRCVMPDLPMMQEKAFNLACRVLGKYFESHLREETHG